jgi:hypothetical protein
MLFNTGGEDRFRGHLNLAGSIYSKQLNTITERREEKLVKK